MKRVLILLFLLSSLMAKDNFLDHEDKRKCEERMDAMEKELTQLKAEQETLQSVAPIAAANKMGLEENEKKIAKILMMKQANDKKVAQIANSLASIKDIMAESKDKLVAARTETVVEPAPAMESVDLSGYVKKEEVTRQGVEVDSLMDRVAILEKKSMMPSETKPTVRSTMEEAKSAIYDYFEYYVIVTVILFFMMFIILFSLVGKTRHLQMVINDILNRE